MAFASAVRVDRDEILAFLRPRHQGMIVTTRRDGRPQISPVTLGLNDQGRILIASYPQRAKTHNIRRDPRVSVCVMSEGWTDPYVQVDGTASVIDLPDAVEPLVDYFRSVAGEHPDWDEYRDAMRQQGKCLLDIAIERWGPIASGGFPPELGED